MTADQENYGFPPGYFVIHSIASNRLLDVAGDSIDDGTEIMLWHEKENSLVESFRGPESNNQVFFIDTSGALCSRSSGHAIDVEDGRLILRHRRPVSFPFPNAYSHPLPQFHHSPRTGEITVTFDYDPTYPTHSAPSAAWRDKSYHLTAMPTRKPRTFIDDASEMLSSAFQAPFSLFSGTPKPQTETQVNEAFDLREDELLEQDRGEYAEVDDSPTPGRKVRVIGTTEEDARSLGAKARGRRQWRVMPLRRTAKKTV